MWFDKIMEDCKQALIISNKNKGIFIPIFIQLVISIFAGIVIFIIAFASIFGIINSHFYSYNIWDEFIKILPFLIISSTIFAFIFIVLNALIEVGSINLYKAAAQGTKPSAKIFLQGIKSYFLKVFGGSIFLGMVTLVLSPLLFALFILYTLIIGVLSAGWGMTFLSAIVLVFFLPWPIIVVLEDVSPLKAIGQSFKFGKENFLPLFIALLGYTLLNRYLVAGFGVFVAALGGWFVSGVLTTYFKVVVLLFYKRESKTEI